MAQVLLLATMTTKVAEANFLSAQLLSAGVSYRVVDISLETGGAILDGDDKCRAMSVAASQAIETILAHSDVEVVLGLGGGTGGEIALQVLRALPVTVPKVLVTTLPFDPRPAVADNAITIVPTLADISGLNDTLRDTFENAALMVAGLCQKTRKCKKHAFIPSVGITALGATDDAVRRLVERLALKKREATVFHSNGYGGAAFARFAERDCFDAIIDLTPHELTRIHIAGAHVSMPTRFSAAGHRPRVVLPGALNFIGLGQKEILPKRYLERPHYQHSALFTHVKVTEDEMARVSHELAQSLNALKGPSTVILPMGGFSHHDRPGGAIEDPILREVCAEILEAEVQNAPVIRLDTHISAPEVTNCILTTLTDLTA
jgi:uncharacterized protein (UPF0261 family)